MIHILPTPIVQNLSSMPALLKRIILLALLYSLSCTNAVQVSNTNVEPALVQNLKAVVEGEKVLLTWETPPAAPTFFRLYRTTSADSLGQPDSMTWLSYDRQKFIGASKSSFLDLPGVEHGRYYYAIQGGNVVVGSDRQSDTLFGPLSQFAFCDIGNAIRFFLFDTTISSEYSANVRTVIAKVLDPRLELDSVRFTNSELVDTGTGLFEPTAQLDIAHPLDDAKQLLALNNIGWPTAKRTKASIVRVPLFKTGGFKIGTNTNNSFPFLLSEGFGKKFSYAQVRYKNGQIDTVLDFIETVPRKVNLELRNTRQTMFDTSLSDNLSGGGNYKRNAIIYGKELLFGVKNFAGNSIDTAFDAWIVFANDKANETRPFRENDVWYMTKPITYSLTGKGDRHNADTVYSFPLSIVGDNRYFTFDNLLKGKGTAPVENIQANGSEQIRQANQNLFNKLQQSEIRSIGRKRFLFVTRFRDTEFNTEFLRVMGASENSDSFFTCRDIYPPRVTQQVRAELNPYHINDGDVLSDVFSYALDSLSVTDVGGFAPTVAVSLVMARKPESMVWNKSKPDAITLELLEKLPHYEKMFDIPQYGFNIAKVIFEGIDPRKWTSGQYIFAVKVRDAFGNEGIAIPNVDSQYNPFLVNVKTSY